MLTRVGSLGRFGQVAIAVGGGGGGLSLPSWVATSNRFAAPTDISSASWSRTQLTGVTAEAVTSPYAGYGGDQVIENVSASTAHYVSQTISVGMGTVSTLRAIVKGAGRNFALYAQGTAFAAAQAGRWDLSTGTGTIITGTPVLASTDLGDGWWLVESTVVPTSTANGLFILRLVSGVSVSYAGDGASGVYIVAAGLDSPPPTPP